MEFRISKLRTPLYFTGDFKYVLALAVPIGEDVDNPREWLFLFIHRTHCVRQGIAVADIVTHSDDRPSGVNKV